MAADRNAPLDLSTARARVVALLELPAARALAAADAGARHVLLVGGALRDAALGAPVADLDAVARHDGAGIAARLAAALGGRLVHLAPGRFAAYRVVAPIGEIDLWDLEGGPLDADLARRDLTVNAVALELDGTVVDPHGGLADLVARRLRAVRAATFAEDPLRVLRLARFAATLAGFSIEPDTGAAARAAAPGLERLAGERIREELAALATRALPAAAQRALTDVGAFPGLWSGRWAPAGDDGVAAFARLARARERLGAACAPEELAAADHALRLALVHPAAERAPALDRLARRALLTRRQQRAASALLAAADAGPAGGDALRIRLWRLGALWASGLAVGAALAPPGHEVAWSATLAEARELVAERGERLLAPRPLLSGAEAAALAGVAPGPGLGAALAALVEAQVLGRVESVEAARAFLAGRARAGRD